MPPLSQPSFPKYEQIVRPLLAELLRRGGQSGVSEPDSSGRTIMDVLADHFNLSEESRQFLIYEANGTPRSKWYNMVRWARNELCKRKLVDGSEYGVWRLTAAGTQEAQRAAPSPGRQVVRRRPRGWI
jgi:restriction endonuclease Mrr